MSDTSTSARAPEAPDGANQGPVLLFDGLCNLCDSSVQWVIRHDRKNRFRYASLQSNAAQTLIGSTESPSLPDSVVLVDGAGVHVRSAAAIRVALHLGFPYSLLWIAFLIPPSLRDALYSWIASNRYRWFGRRQTCMMPTPELRDRFLDADEPLDRVESDARTDAPGSPARRTDALAHLTRPLHRVFMVYVVMYVLPFPAILLGYLAQLPGLASLPSLGAILTWPATQYSSAKNEVVLLVGRVVFDVQASTQATGSGDRTFDYLEVLVNLSVAIGVGLTWTAMCYRQAISERSTEIMRVLVRYYLAFFLLVYGWIKVFPLQFVPPAPDRMIQSYGDSSPMGLMWTFMGASAGYQVFAGLSELAGGYLMFFRRTTTLGALVASGVMLNVFLMNLFYDVPVKLFSLHLLVLALYLVAADLPRLAGLFYLNVPVSPRTMTPFWHSSTVVRRGLLITKAVIIIGLTVSFVSTNSQRYLNSPHYFKPHAITGIYTVSEFELDGSSGAALELEERLVRVGFNSPYAVTLQYADGRGVRMRMQLDEEAGTLALFDRGGTPPEENPLDFTLDDHSLHIEGLLEGRSVRIELVRQSENPLLSKRGFHWINEYPFNR